MARFDVYRLRDGGGLVLDCQSDLLSHLDTRFVVPLIEPGNGPVPAQILNPLIPVGDIVLAMYPQFAATIPASALGEVVTSVRAHEFAIGWAIDFLTTGF
jgi:toxin CcdB